MVLLPKQLLIKVIIDSVLNQSLVEIKYQQKNYKEIYNMNFTFFNKPVIKIKMNMFDEKNSSYLKV